MHSDLGMISLLLGLKINKMEYTQKEIREAHKRVSKDIDNAVDTAKGIELAMECQNLVLDHLTNIMTEKEKPEEEEETEEEQAKE